MRVRSQLVDRFKRLLQRAAAACHELCRTVESDCHSSVLSVVVVVRSGQVRSGQVRRWCCSELSCPPQANVKHRTDSIRSVRISWIGWH